MSPVPRSTEPLNVWIVRAKQQGNDRKGMRSFLAGTGQNWTAAVTCAVFRLNLVENVRDKRENKFFLCRPQWLRGLRRRPAAARLPRFWVRMQSGAWMFVVTVVCCQIEVCATS
jgi:hypothetical protein